MLLIFYSVIILNTCLFQYVYDGNAKASLKQLYSFALCCKKYFTVDSSSCDFKVTFVIFPFFKHYAISLLMAVRAYRVDPSRRRRCFCWRRGLDAVQDSLPLPRRSHN